MSNILIIKHGSLGDISQISGALRDIKENQKWRKRDPLQILETHGKDKKYITDADLELINKQVTEEIESAVEISQKTPPTSRESAFKEIYKKPFGEI